MTRLNRDNARLLAEGLAATARTRELVMLANRLQTALERVRGAIRFAEGIPSEKLSGRPRRSQGTRGS